MSDLKYVKSQFLLDQAIAREQDSSLVFINVADDPKRSSKRILNLIKNQPELEIEPIDMSSMFDGTKPINENNIDELFSIMTLNKTCPKEDLPSEIRIMVPDKDCIDSMGVIDTDVQFDLYRYVCADMLPKELRRVVMSYLSMSLNQTNTSYSYFEEDVEKLAEAVRQKKE